MGGSFAAVRVAGFKWNRWQTSAVYAAEIGGEADVGLIGLGLALEDVDVVEHGIFLDVCSKSS